MDVLIEDLPLVNEGHNHSSSDGAIVTKSDEADLLGWWVDIASTPMMADGVIKWNSTSRAERRFLKKLTAQLEIDVPGLKFQKVKNPEIAEILFRKTERFDDYFTLGLAYWTETDPRWKITVRHDISNVAALLVHELGHALGLGHPEDGRCERDTIMSYHRDKSIHYFHPKDIDLLTGIYFA